MTVLLTADDGRTSPVPTTPARARLPGAERVYTIDVACGGAAMSVTVTVPKSRE